MENRRDERDSAIAPSGPNLAYLSRPSVSVLNVIEDTMSSYQWASEFMSLLPRDLVQAFVQLYER